MESFFGTLQLELLDRRRWDTRRQLATAVPYRRFAEAVRQAQAQARVAAEAEVRRLQPFHWLRYGPGRERPGEPGWTDQHLIVDERSEQLAALGQMSVDELRRLARDREDSEDGAAS